MQIIRNLTELDYLEIADTYNSASDYLQRCLGMSVHSRYTKVITQALKDYDIEWLYKAGEEGRETKHCPQCNKSFTSVLSDKQITCSKSCSALYQPRRGNLKQGKYIDYRKLAFKHLPHKCNKCGEVEQDFLVVHHKDKNRYNHSIENLEILCANCHLRIHSVA